MPLGASPPCRAFTWLMFAPELRTSAIALAAITQLPDGGGAAGPVKPAARQGRSEAEWLDRAEDRRTIVGVMAVTCGHQVLSARTHETNGTRGLEVCEEVTLGERLKALIRCECAFTYMNAVSGENLSGVLLPMNST
jgi:hypothetical protein